MSLSAKVANAPGSRIEKKSISPMKNFCGSKFIRLRYGTASSDFLTMKIPSRMLETAIVPLLK